MSDETLQEAAALYREHGNISAAARAAGMPRNTMQNRVHRAAERGLLGTDPVMPGFRVAKASTTHDEAGAVVRRHIQQLPERGDAFALPAGHVVKGYSTLTDGEGRTIQQWVKTRLDDSGVDLVETLKTTFAEYSGRAELAPEPAACDADLVTFYNIADHHLGLFSWSQETGEDFDLKIGEAALRGAMRKLVGRAPNSETAVVLNLGDFFHADNGENRTAKSGNVLDVDTRYAKVLQIGVKLMIECVELALQKHRTVIVRCLPGNHDPHTALALSVALAAFFSANERVTVDCDPGKFFWFRFGKVFVGATHGDMVKPAQMPGVMASYKAREWGETEFRYAYFGHVHHSSKGGGEEYGVTWETFQTLAAKDAWHHASGYRSGRSMVAITHHRENGEDSRHTVTVARALSSM